MPVPSVDHRSHAGRVAIAVEAAAARNVCFMEAMVAAGALMAFADGEMAVAERRRLLQSLREAPKLASFSRDEIVEELAGHEANFHYDPELAQLLAREKLVPLAGDARSARRVVDACRRIVAADGVMHPAEYRVLQEIADALGVAAAAPGFTSARIPPAGK